MGSKPPRRIMLDTRAWLRAGKLRECEKRILQSVQRTCARTSSNALSEIVKIALSQFFHEPRSEVARKESAHLQ